MAAPRKKQPVNKTITPAARKRAEELKSMDQRIGKAVSFLSPTSRGWVQDNWARYSRVEDIPEPYKSQILAAEKKAK